MGQFTSRVERNGVHAAESRFAASDEELRARFPAVFEFICEQLDDNGVQRVTSTLLVCAEEGRWKICLIDRAGVSGQWDYKLWKSGDTLFEALSALDEDLQRGNAEWRKSPKWKPNNKR